MPTDILITRKPVTRIISGGQTGADRGGLLAAIALSIPHGGWCPAGRRAEDGVIPVEFEMREASSSDYNARTYLNVSDAHGTAIFTMGSKLGPGSRLTLRHALQLQREHIHINLDMTADMALRAFQRWLNDCTEFGRPVTTLNVAGSRESSARGIQDKVRRFLIAALRPDPTLPRRNGLP